MSRYARIVVEKNESQAGAGQSGPVEPRGATSAAAIVAAAERLAAEITRNAEAEAVAIRARAGSDSDAARSAINERVRRLSALADGISERLGEMRRELDALNDSLGGPPAVAVPKPGGVRPVAAVPGPDDGSASTEAASDSTAPATGIDDAGARLIALNLALSDTPRDEAARQLRGQVPDPERLVDEVYASVDR